MVEIGLTIEFEDDNEAAEQAERDGIKIIHDMEFDDENYTRK